MKHVVLCLLLAVLCVSPAFSEAYLSANDLDPASLPSSKTFDDVTIIATADKGVTIERIDQVREAADGEVFNLRIKLNGSGKPTYRCVSVPAKAGETLTVYLNSSSKTDARILAVTTADGTEVGTITAPADDGAHAGIGTFTIPKDGAYLLFSKGSGINLYAVVVE
ncbi:MAG: hypothetical protein LKJ89_01415 [Sphaerochaeta sp.]|jgi:hypothetical protein|nr:hypothetical protein [Sphaerochaeta sp.]MCI2076520.1 hypothetical protein [Sphaerochaeta sp.]